MKVYEIVTADKYELPLVQADSIPMLADKTGLKTGHLFQMITRKGSGRSTGYRVVKVEFDEKEDI